MSNHNNIYKITIKDKEIFFYSGHESATRANLGNFRIDFEKLELYQTITDKKRNPVYINHEPIITFTELAYHFGSQTDYSKRMHSKENIWRCPFYKSR